VQSPSCNPHGHHTAQDCPNVNGYPYRGYNYSYYYGPYGVYNGYSGGYAQPGQTISYPTSSFDDILPSYRNSSSKNQRPPGY